MSPSQDAQPFDDGTTGWRPAHDRWVNAALALAVIQMLVAPLLTAALTPAQLLIFLHSPGYMLHQVEEHLGDRFRTFVNDHMFGGVNAMTTRFIMWVNCVWVWGLNLLALAAALMLDPGYGLVAPYAMVVNGIGHVATSLRNGAYNPGLVSSLLVFLPLGAATLWIVPGTITQHVLALGIVIALHGAIVANAKSRAPALRAAGTRASG